MKTDCVNNTIFGGKLVITNHLSNKPNNCINKLKDSLEGLVQKKDYNLYVTQDYSMNKICITVKYPVNMLNQAGETIPINAKHSKYIDAAKSAIAKYDKALLENEQIKWEQKQKQNKIQELKDILETIVLFPLFGINELLDFINPKLSKKFEKLIDKMI